MFSFSPIDVQNSELVYFLVKDEQWQVLHDKDFVEACPVWSALRKAPVSVFVKTIDGLYSFDLKSGPATKFPITIEFYSTTSFPT